MDTRPLGLTGIEVPRIGLGTVKLGRNAGVKYPAGFELPSDAAVEALLQSALALGAALLDTAPAYGTSETRLADFLARHRQDVVLVSKAGETFDGERSTYDFAPGAIRASVERSLERLGVANLDVLLLHTTGDDAEVLRTPGLRAELARLKAEGLTRAVGSSARSDAGVRAAIDDGLDVVMAGFSLAHPDLADSLAAAHARGLGVLAIKGLASGHLVNPNAPAGRPATPAEAVRFVTGQPFVDCLVVGTLNADHLRQAVEAAS